MTSAAPNAFPLFAEKMRREGLAQIVIDNFHHYYDALVAGTTGVIGEGEIEPVASVPSEDDVAAYAEAGRRAVRHAAVLKLNGGLGTSMGLEKAKSLLVARSGLTFLDIIAHQNIETSKRYGVHVPLILMNSFSTDADTNAVLDTYPDLRSAIPLTLLQNKVPKVRQDTLEPVEWPSEPDLEWCPPGHGEVYIALQISGVLDTLLSNGYEYLFISNSDNLGATLDLGILGYVAERKIPFLMEVAARTEADKKGGHLARHTDGRLLLREVAQCPKEDLDAFQDIQRHRYFNTNNIWLNLGALKQVLQQHNNVLKLPMIRNSKTADPRNSSSPPVYQLETAMGAAIEVFAGAEALLVSRDRFMPVKMCSDLLVLRSDVYVMDEEYRLRPNPARQLGPITTKLDDRFYKLIDDFETRFPESVPSLVDCSRLEVRGDVVFEQDVVCQGNVVIIRTDDGQGRVVNGTHLADQEYNI